jgi:DNA modification methylase
MARRGARPPHPLHGRSELLWEGKYDARGRRRLPDASAHGASLAPTELYPAQGPVRPAQSAVPAIPADWRNRLVLGDNLAALACLLPELRGAVQLVYLDPPFGSGADYALNLGAAGDGPAARAAAYGDRWEEQGSYLSFMAERLVLLRELLTPRGCLFLHCDWHSHASLRLLLDEIFGADHFVNEIVWHYYNKYSRGRHCLPRAHDTILVYGRTRAPAINPLRLPREAPRRQLMRRNVGGVLRNARDAEGRLMYRIAYDKKADDVWTIPQLQPASREWTGYATQKHPLLLERILSLASQPGDLVADFFCGAGTTLSVAQRMGRRFVGCDLGLPAVHIARRRLVQAPGPRPALSVLRVRDGAGGAGGGVRSWRAQILERLGATPEAQRTAVQRTAVRRTELRRAGKQRAEVQQTPAHGRLRGWPVWVHAGDAPLTARQALRLAGQARGAAGGRLICCAAEFEPGFWERLDALREDAAGSGRPARLLPVQIPRAWLTQRGAPPLPLRLLPRLHARVERDDSAGRASVRVRLTGYEALLLDEALAGRGGHARARGGLEAVDCWAVDPDWRPGQVFTAAWVAARLRRPRELVLTTPPLEGAAAPRVLVQAWDAVGTAATAWIEAVP